MNMSLTRSQNVWQIFLFILDPPHTLHVNFSLAQHIPAKPFFLTLQCASHDVVITESMADGMTPPKTDGDAAGEAAGGFRSAVIRRIAECCEAQGSFHLACKKFTQANARARAMEALLKSGDTEKIIFFANVSR